MSEIITNGDFTISTTYSTCIVNSSRFSNGEIKIMEYEIDEAFNENNYRDNVFYYPKRIFSTLLQHMTQIICDEVGLKFKFCFCLGQKDPYQNPHNIEELLNEVEVVVYFCAPTFSFDQIKNNINAVINTMEDNSYCAMEELEEDVRLTVVKIVILGEKEIISNQFTNGETSFKEETCTICLERIPNVLYCNCGHICVCEKCNEIKKLNLCPVCKTENNILRIIE